MPDAPGLLSVFDRVYLSRNGLNEQIVKLALNLMAMITFGGLLLWLRPHVRHMKWKLPVQLSLLFLLMLTSLLEMFNYLFSEEGALPRSFVEGFSYVVFLVALVNFIVLGYCFWFVVFRKKDRDYYGMHFMMQRKGGLTGSAQHSTHPGPSTAQTEGGFSKIALSTNPSRRLSISDSVATARLTKAISPRSPFPRQSRQNRFNEIRSMEEPVLEDIKRVTRNKNFSPTESLRSARSAGNDEDVQISMSSNDSPLSSKNEHPAIHTGRERAQTQAID
eukprot:CAMPEP_0185262968 /NCGR_PEP_ID=MMETSP1359-20130426/10970_1 /TAXON_ID=552665 /ORGANISM="Bigelowiella longifila, Strain CCMP242" /LENGTH=275 /DNA_ID=CAMNT_0027850045 /DNA_START=286 /DNA_END=1114 /DNA_ORIENTATION=+